MMPVKYERQWAQLCDQQDWSEWARTADLGRSMKFDWLKCPGGLTELFWNDFLKFRVWQRGETSDLAARCLDVAWVRSEEALQRNLFEQERPANFPANRRNFLEAKIFIDGVVQRKALSKDTALQLAGDMAVVASDFGQRQWDGWPQSMYQHTIDVLLLVDAYDEADAMVANARSMRALHVKELFATAKLILKEKSLVRDNEQAKAEYRRMFDLLRDPDYPDGKRGHPAFYTQRLVMACMWQKFFEPGDGAYDYDRAIDLIWE